jgi:hypothetical protein
MNEQDRPMLGQDDVGTSGQVCPMQPETKAESMRGLSREYFRLRVFVAHGAHVLRPLFAGQMICHGNSTALSKTSYQYISSRDRIFPPLSG